MKRLTSLSVVARGALLLVAVAIAPGCSSDPKEGYSFKGAHSESIRTVAVPIFDNRTYSTGVEVELTEAIVKEIQRTTGWTISSAGAADATLSGVVQGADFRTLSTDRQTGLVQEVGVEVRVDFELRDNRTGRVMVSRQNFAAMDTFGPSIRVGERPEVGRTATVATLARDIVGELRESW